MNRLIFHVDVNSAFLSWESARRVKSGLTDLRTVPAIVGGDPQSRTSVVLAKSIPARKYHIITGEPVSSALRKCPDLIIVPSDFRLYAECSMAFKSICREYAPAVEEFSIDECFLDMSGTSRIYPDPIRTAYEIKDKIRDTLGFTVNIGIANNKVLAKMASDFEKPDKVHTLFPEDLPKKMWPLPVGELFLCGRASADKLSRAHIRTIGDLALASLPYVQSLLGVKLGKQLYEYANGIDDTPVLPEAEPAKGYSNETTFEDDVLNYETADRVLLFLADSVASRIRRHQVKASCISVTIRGNDMHRHSHQRHLANATDITNEIYEVSKELLREMWQENKPLRLMGIALTNLDTEEYVQSSIFDYSKKREQEKKADQVMDSLRAKYGRDIIKRGSMLGADLRVGRKDQGREEAYRRERNKRDS